MKESSSNKRNSGTKSLKKFENGIAVMKQFFYLIFDTIFDGIEFIVSRLFRIANAAKIVKVLALVASLAAAYYSIDWAFEFVNNPPAGYSGGEVAAIVGAVLAPITGIITGVLLRLFYGKPVENPNCELPAQKTDESIGDSNEK